MGAQTRDNDPFNPVTHALIPPPLLCWGMAKGYPWRDSGYYRTRHAASLHLGPFYVQWRMPYR